jgi:hypothetical protein
VAIYHNWQTSPNSGWSGAYELGGSVFDQIAVGQNLDGRLEIFYPNDGHVICHNWQTSPNSGWSGGAYLGGMTASNEVGTIAVGRNTDGRLEIFYPGTNGHIYHNWQTSANNGWSGENELGGASYGPIAVAPGVNPNGGLEIYYVGTDLQLYNNWQTNGWNGENLLGGYPKSVAVGRNADGRLEVFYVSGMNGRICHNWQIAPGSGWSGENELGGDGDLQIAVAENADGRLEIFYRNTL